jgi:hypothetical protein
MITLTPRLPSLTYGVTWSATISTSSLVVSKSSNVGPVCFPVPWLIEIFFIQIVITFAKTVARDNVGGRGTIFTKVGF